MSNDSKSHATKLSNVCTHFIEAGWLLVLVVSPLYFHFAAARHFEEAKVLLVRLIIGVMLLAWLATLPGRRETGQAGHRGPWTTRLRAWLTTPLVVPALFLFLTHALSTAASLQPGQSLWGAHARLQGLYTDLTYLVLFLFVATYLRTRRQLNRLLVAVVLASVPVALYGVIQRYGGDPFSSGALDRVHSSLGNAVFLAAYLIMIVPLALLKAGESLVALLGGRRPRSPHVWLLAAYGGVLAIQLLAVEFTRSRGPVLGMLGGLFVMVLAILLTRRRNLWAAWLAAALLLAVALVGLNLSWGPSSTVAESVRKVPGIGRLAGIGQERDASRSERSLSWDAALELFSAQRAIGIPGDELAPQDKLRAIRPLLGYGPEMVQSCFPSVYPPELARISFRSLVPNRIHNQTLDALVTTGALGTLAYYLFVIALSIHAVRGFGWKTTGRDTWILAALMILGALLGVVVASLLDGSGSRFTYAGLGIPFGMIVGLVTGLGLRGLSQIRNASRAPLSWNGALTMALFAAVIGHVLEVQFSFSMPVTAVHFWVFAGVIAAMQSIPRGPETEPAVSDSDASPEPMAQPPDNGNKGKKKRRQSRRSSRSRAAKGQRGARRAPLDWIAGQGIVTAALLVTFVFSFVSTRQGLSGTVLACLLVTWLVGLVTTLAEAVSRGMDLKPGARLFPAITTYVSLSLGGVLAFAVVHSLQLGRWNPLPARQLVVENADVLTTSWLLFLLAILALMLLFAWQRAGELGHLPIWVPRKSWTYLLLAALLLPLLWIKDIGVARAEIYARESTRYRDAARWPRALALNELACKLDRGNDSCPLQLAMLYRGMSAGERANSGASSFDSERQALEQARRAKPYGPEHAVNLARFRFDLAQRGDPRELTEALRWAEKALLLAPYDVRNHDLCADILIKMQRFDLAAENSRAALRLDAGNFPSWQKLGDALALQGRHDEAMENDQEAMRLAIEKKEFSAFADRGFDSRLRRYKTSDQLEEMIAFLEQLAAAWPEDAGVRWAVGRACEFLPDETKTLHNYRQALPLLIKAVEANPSDAATRSRLSMVYALLGVDQIERGNHAEAAKALERAVALDAGNSGVHKNLGIVYYYHLGRRQEGVAHLRRALELRPNSPEAKAIASVIEEYDRAQQP